MKMSRSSIFSFDTLQLAGAPRGWVVSLALALVLIGIAEAGARLLLAPVASQAWAYWDGDAAAKFEWYRRQASKASLPPVVVVGDSIAARNFDPAAFTAASGVPAFNLGWPGMFPLALDAIVLPLLERGQAPATVLLMQSPTSFVDDDRVRRNEAPIVGSIQARRARGETVPADHIALSRLYLARDDVMSYWRGGGDGWGRVAAKGGFMPHARPRAAKPAALGAQEAPTGELSAQRMAVNRRLIELAHARSIRVVAVISPTAFDTPPGLVIRYREAMTALAAEFPETLEIWDLTLSEAVTRGDFKDWLHFWEDGAGRFSKELAMRFEDRTERR